MHKEMCFLFYANMHVNMIQAAFKIVLQMLRNIILSVFSWNAEQRMMLQILRVQSKLQL